MLTKDNYLLRINFIILWTITTVNVTTANTQIIADGNNQKSNIEKELKDNSIEERAIALLLSGTAHFENGKFGQAYEDFKLYIETIKKLNDKDKLIEANFNVGQVYKQKLVFDVALDFFMMALTLNSGKPTLIAGDICKAIGGLYYDQEDNDNAYKYYLQSLELYEKNGARQESAAAYNNLGEIFRLNKEYDKALEFYFRAVAINKEFNNVLYLATNYNNIGTVYLNLERNEEAFEFIDNCRKLLEEGEYTERLAAVYSSIGNYYFITGDYKKSIENYLITINYNPENLKGNAIVTRDAYLGLSKGYKELGDIHKAYTNYVKYTELKDIIFNMDKQKKIFEVQTRYATEQKEQEFRYVQERTEKELEKKRNQRIVLIFAIILLVLVIMLLVYSYILKSRTLKQRMLLFDQKNKLNKLELEKKKIENKKLSAENKSFEAKDEISRLHKEKLESELQHKNRELSTSALHVISKNEMLSSIKTSLENIVEDNKGKQKNELDILIREIVNNINLDKDWDTFKMHFEQVHQGFFSRLKKRSPELTGEELKLCAYLRINLTSKEIANMLNITPIAINKRRNRLRKKLTLGAREDLFDYMTNI